MRTILASILVCVVLLFGWNELVKRKLHRLQTTSAAGQFDQNLIKAQSFLYTSWQPRVVIAGSSIAARLTKHPADWYNLSFPGCSALTGLNIVAHSDKRPDVILVETNVLTIDENQQLLDALTSPVLGEARAAFPGLRERYKPSHVLVTALPELTSGGGRPQLSSDLFEEQLNRRMLELSNPPAPEQLVRVIAKLRTYITTLEANGIRVVLFEMPEHGAYADLPRHAVLRSAIRTAFPPETYAWAPSVPWDNYRTTDAVHLDRDSADRFAGVIANFVLSLHRRQPASQPSPSDAAFVNLTHD